MNQDEPIKIKLPETRTHKETKISPELEQMYTSNNCGAPDNYYDKKCNEFLLKKELLEHEELEKEPDSDPYLYPNLNDPNFIIKIAEKKEFNDTKYDGRILDIKEQAEILSNAEFEMAPHQAFVRNFMSFQTPYNSLLLYHGLGSGKTLSSIGVCEEMREYSRQMGINKRIIIVASPNVQDNFRSQLFDERKMKKADGSWTSSNFISNKLIKEVNPMSMKTMPKEKIISQIKTLINSSYLFLGYGEFANYIQKVANMGDSPQRGEKERSRYQLRNLRNEFNSRLIVIDEVHNIRITEDNANKKVAINLQNLVTSAENMRLLFLSATPMYNSYKEIIWLLNLMNINDRRGTIEIKDVFDKNGNFKNGGEELLARKATGYVSFVRGDNPYTFPFRVFPNEFNIKQTFKNTKNKYPKYQMNGKEISKADQLHILDSNIFLTKIGSSQAKGYQYIIDRLRRKQITITDRKGVVRNMPSFENMESFGYTLLQMPLEALNIVYPLDVLDDVIEHVKHVEDYSDESLGSKSDFSQDSLEIIVKPKKKRLQTSVKVLEPEPEPEPELEEGEQFLGLTDKKSSEKSISSLSGGQTSSSSKKEAIIDPHDLTGMKGLERIMTFVNRKTPPEFGQFEYRESAASKYGNIFSPKEIGKYSSKIKAICESIVSPSGKPNEGIILIYSQYIAGGLVPMALALEEMGFTRFGENAKPLFKTPPVPVVDSRTMQPRTDKKAEFMPARYAMITGDPRISPNNNFDVKALTGSDNIDGNKIKVILISKAGSEGIDFKYIRQVHILEPWYNMNRMEQIIGRAVRNFSHKDLPFEKRNVQLFLHGTLLEDKNEESADVYVYRVAEYKAVQIGKVSRLLKETSVDCIINYEQSNFTQEILSKELDTKITQVLSDGQKLTDFKAGDAPYSAACDYMEDCQYKCRPFKEITDEDLKVDTYNESFIMMNSEKIIQKIRILMKERFFYLKRDLIERINAPKKYPLVQIYAALTHMIQDTNETITDKFGRSGHLINIDEYYLFQPSELNNENVSVFERSVPMDFKHSMIQFDVSPEITKSTHLDEPVQDRVDKNHSEAEDILKNLKTKYDLAREYMTPGKSVSSSETDDNNWYRYAGIVIRKMTEQGSSLDDLLGFLIEHIIDTTLFDDKLKLMNYLYSLDVVDERSFEGQAKEYFDGKILKTSALTAIILYNMDTRKIMKLDEDSNRWIDAEAEDLKDLSQVIKEVFSVKSTDFNNIMGFVGADDKKKFLLFKLKNMKEKRHTGARCDQKTKAKVIELLNAIEGHEKYTKENTKGVIQAELCTLQEFILRSYNKTKKDGKLWFLDSEKAKIYGF
jgi:Type III restriction enzyme, res subunit/Helicase conserved C-terminal domain